MPASIQNRLRVFRKSALSRSILISAVVGVFLVSIGRVEILSYDVATWLRPEVGITNAAWIYVDKETLKALPTYQDNLDRACYARLLDRLTEAHARLVFMDVFLTTHSKPDADQALAKAIRKNGNVILVTPFEQQGHTNGALVQTQEGPIPEFEQGAKGIGHDKLTGNIVRTIPMEYDGFTGSAAWVAATNLKASLISTESTKRWLNYYGPPEREVIPSRSLEDVLSNNIPPGFLDKEVFFVGQKVAYDVLATARDTAATPYSRFGSPDASAILVHATAILNLTRGDWVTRLPLPVQWLGAIAWAFLSVWLLYSLSRRSRLVLVSATIFGIVVLGVLGVLLQSFGHLSWEWIGPAFAQTPLALLLALRAPKPDPYIAFISYRTDEDGSTALLIARSLSDRGLKVFLDVNSLHAGKFDEQLLNEIDAATYFILLLSPNSLARCANPDDWVLREISHALAKGKAIIPVLKSGFRFDAKEGIPDLPQIAELTRFHGVAYATKDFDGFMKQLESLLVR